MAGILSGRSLVRLSDFDKTEIRLILDLSHEVKRERKSGVIQQRFLGRTLALIFEKRSTRTRCAFETAFGEEGGHPVFLSVDDIQLGTKESVEDTARVLGRMFNGIMFRGYEQATVEKLAANSGVPVFNGLTDTWHPTQVLADLMTIEEHFGGLEGKRVAFVGDGRNNVARSLMVGGAKMGLRMAIVAPNALSPDPELLASVRKLAQASRGAIEVTESVEFGVKGADVIYTDVWTSMGEEDKRTERESLLLPYQVNDDLMQQTGNPGCVFMHCLPAVKGSEVTAEVIDGAGSLVWDQAENRKHTIKALMIATML
ncbi:MAG TPA: ornithine carbamoyltransferase [Spirochaetia bacterium]|nr:ornithine carbamoyltransferase [Spirochaetia bacterium]